MFSGVSPLHDPVFVLVWQIHLAVAALFAIFGIWWGLTRRPWYVPPTLLLALLWLFVPLAAPEPALWLLVSVAGLAGISRLLDRMARPPAPLGEEGEVRNLSRLSFKLSDAFWLTFVMALLCAVLSQLSRLPWPSYRSTSGGFAVDWSDIAINAACLLAIAAAVLCAALQRTMRRRLMAAAASLAAVLCATVVHSLLQNELLFIADWGLIIRSLTTPSIFFSWGTNAAEVVWLYGVSFLEFALVVAIGLGVVGPRQAAAPSRAAAVLRYASGGGLVLLVAGLAVVYVEILNRPGWPEEQFPSQNRREELRAILASHGALNPQELSVDDLRAASGDAEAQKVLDLFAEMDELLRSDSITWFDSRVDRPDPEVQLTLVDVQSARSVARALGAQAKADWGAGRHQSAIRNDLLCLRLGAVFQHRGLGIDSLVGIAIEGMSIHHLSSVRGEVAYADATAVITALREAHRNREPQDLLVRRDEVYTEKAYGWREQLSSAVGRLLGQQNDFYQSWEDVCARRDVRLLLLQTDLAIRCYQQKHGALPSDLASLVPAKLSAVPIDPYSAKPLVYRVEGDGYLLYSVGQNGKDDGGRFGSAHDLFKQPDNRDIDLDTWLRESS